MTTIRHLPFEEQKRDRSADAPQKFDTPASAIESRHQRCLCIHMLIIIVRTSYVSSFNALDDADDLFDRDALLRSRRNQDVRPRFVSNDARVNDPMFRKNFALN